MSQLYKLIEIIDYNKGKKIRQKEYFVEYFICPMGCKFSLQVVFIFKIWLNMYTLNFQESFTTQYGGEQKQKAVWTVVIEFERGK